MGGGPSEADKPIGIFDSGVGGLTVMAALCRSLPAESVLYLGDTARLPYGSKSSATIQRYTASNIRFLLGRGVKAVIVACNTASAMALPFEESTVPVWGVIDSGAAAVAAIAKQRVGILATESTVRSKAYPRALARLRPELEVVAQACPLFVPLVEEGWIEDPITEQVARRYLEPLLEQRVDTLLLGCTHYPLLGGLLRRIAGEEIQVVDSAAVVAREVSRQLAAAGLLREGEAAPEHCLCVTDAGAPFQRLSELILGPRASLEWVEV